MFESLVSEETRSFRVGEPFSMESGGTLHNVQVAYRSWGRLNSAGDNCVLVCHALTGSADVDDWWNGVIGPGRALDPDVDFIVCSNVLGGCYGTTGPCSQDPGTGRPYGPRFPPVTIRDMVRLQHLLLESLGVRGLAMVVGGSMGGMQVQEWALLYPHQVESLTVIGAPGHHSAWSIGLAEAQRQAIQADREWKGGDYAPDAPPAAGLAAARMVAMCSYRSWESFRQRFHRDRRDEDLYEVESYLRHHGEKLVGRFDANTYLTLTRAMDGHDLGRGRNGYTEVLNSIRQPTLIVAIDTDVLYTLSEHEELVAGIPNAELSLLSSPHGHDAFLIDQEAVSDLIRDFRDRTGTLPLLRGSRAGPEEGPRVGAPERSRTGPEEGSRVGAPERSRTGPTEGSRADSRESSREEAESCAF